jgi:hypothetical protein
MSPDPQHELALFLAERNLDASWLAQTRARLTLRFPDIEPAEIDQIIFIGILQITNAPLDRKGARAQAWTICLNDTYDALRRLSRWRRVGQLPEGYDPADPRCEKQPDDFLKTQEAFQAIASRISRDPDFGRIFAAELQNGLVLLPKDLVRRLRQEGCPRTTAHYKLKNLIRSLRSGPFGSDA